MDSIIHGWTIFDLVAKVQHLFIYFLAPGGSTTIDKRYTTDVT